MSTGQDQIRSVIESVYRSQETEKSPSTILLALEKDGRHVMGFHGDTSDDRNVRAVWNGLLHPTKGTPKEPVSLELVPASQSSIAWDNSSAKEFKVEVLTSLLSDLSLQLDSVKTALKEKEQALETHSGHPGKTKGKVSIQSIQSFSSLENEVKDLQRQTSSLEISVKACIWANDKVKNLKIARLPVIQSGNSAVLLRYYGLKATEENLLMLRRVYTRVRARVRPGVDLKKLMFAQAPEESVELNSDGLFVKVRPMPPTTAKLLQAFWEKYAKSAVSTMNADERSAWAWWQLISTWNLTRKPSEASYIKLPSGLRPAFFDKSKTGAMSAKKTKQRTDESVSDIRGVVDELSKLMAKTLAESVSKPSPQEKANVKMTDSSPLTSTKWMNLGFRPRSELLALNKHWSKKDPYPVYPEILSMFFTFDKELERPVIRDISLIESKAIIGNSPLIVYTFNWVATFLKVLIDFYTLESDFVSVLKIALKFIMLPISDKDLIEDIEVFDKIFCLPPSEERYKQFKVDIDNCLDAPVPDFWFHGTDDSDYRTTRNLEGKYQDDDWWNDGSFDGFRRTYTVQMVTRLAPRTDRAYRYFAFWPVIALFFGSEGLLEPNWCVLTPEFTGVTEKSPSLDDTIGSLGSCFVTKSKSFPSVSSFLTVRDTFETLARTEQWMYSYLHDSTPERLNVIIERIENDPNISDEHDDDEGSVHSGKGDEKGKAKASDWDDPIGDAALSSPSPSLANLWDGVEHDVPEWHATAWQSKNAALDTLFLVDKNLRGLQGKFWEQWKVVTVDPQWAVTKFSSLEEWEEEIDNCFNAWYAENANRTLESTNPTESGASSSKPIVDDREDQPNLPSSPESENGEEAVAPDTISLSGVIWSKIDLDEMKKRPMNSATLMVYRNGAVYSCGVIGRPTSNTKVLQTIAGTSDFSQGPFLALKVENPKSQDPKTNSTKVVDKSKAKEKVEEIKTPGVKSDESSPKTDSQPEKSKKLPTEEKIKRKFKGMFPGRDPKFTQNAGCICDEYPCRHTSQDIQTLAKAYNVPLVKRSPNQSQGSWTTKPRKLPEVPLKETLPKQDPLKKENPLKVKGVQEKTPKVSNHLKRVTDDQISELKKILKLETTSLPENFASLSKEDKSKELEKRRVPRWATAAVSADPANLAKIASGEITKESKIAGKPRSTNPKAAPSGPEKAPTNKTKKQSVGDRWKSIKEQFPEVGLWSNPRLPAEKRLLAAFNKLKEEVGDSASASLPKPKPRPRNLSATDRPEGTSSKPTGLAAELQGLLALAKVFGEMSKAMRGE